MLQNGKRRSNNHRGRLDIIADILEASVVGIRKTHLMFHCNLSFKQLKSYSRFLLRLGFLRLVDQESHSNSMFFEVTDKGKEFLEAYEGLESLMH